MNNAPPSGWSESARCSKSVAESIFCMPCTFGYQAGVLRNPENPTMDKKTCLSVMFCSVVTLGLGPAALAAFIHRAVRQRYNIEKPVSCCGDSNIECWPCFCCTMATLTDEIIARKEWNGGVLTPACNPRSVEYGPKDAFAWVLDAEDAMNTKVTAIDVVVDQRFTGASRCCKVSLAHPCVYCDIMLGRLCQNGGGGDCDVDCCS